MYKEEKEFNVLRGKVPDFGYDIKMLSVVVDGEKSKTIPTRGLYKTQIDCSNGTRGEWDYNAWNLTLENVSENARCNITFTSNLTEEEYNKYIEAGVSLRRNTYRGKDITSYLTAEGEMNLYTQISSGRFNDIYVGDYIKSTVDGKEIKWLVADIDNYLYSNSMYAHHATIISDDNLLIAAMNDTDTATGGYAGSKMYKTTLPEVLNNYVIPTFGDAHVLTARFLVTNTINANAINQTGGTTTGASSQFTWASRRIDLMSEVNVYGTSISASSRYDSGSDIMQYALFRLNPRLVARTTGGKAFNYWLKDVSASNGFSSTSFLNAGNASTAGVHPRFLIG